MVFELRDLNRQVLIAMIVLVMPIASKAQKSKKTQVGIVSFVTASRVYVKFEDTGAILPGDTLYIANNDRLVPGMIVDQKSSLSIVGKPVGDSKFVKGDAIQFEGGRTLKGGIESVSSRKQLQRKKDPIEGSVSIASYISASSAEDFNARNVARIRLSAREINDSRFSVSSYMIYRQNLESSEDTIYQSAGLFNIYNLFLQYDKENDYAIGVGRKINRRVASLGMIDGLHVEKKLGNLHFGGIAGFRPDPRSNDFNTGLPQFGGYLGASIDRNKTKITATVGLLEQRNAGAVDRRYLYAQGSANLGFGFNLFSSAELDLYTLNSDMSQAGQRLTNLHISTNYRLNKYVRIALSYDTRRQIIFYETFQTYLERLIADNEARQGIRARVTVKPFKGITVGLAYGKRYQNSMDNASNNYNAFAAIRNTPLIGGVLSGNLNVNQSSYLNSISTSVRHSRYFFKNKVSVSNYLRSVVYTYNPERDITLIHQFLGSSMNYFFGNNMTLGGLVEFSLRKAEYKSRINIQLTKRF